MHNRCENKKKQIIHFVQGFLQNVTQKLMSAKVAVHREIHELFMHTSDATERQGGFY